jgi:hypothetical protein
MPAPHFIISNRGLPIDRARDDLVKQAQAVPQCSHIFFLDSDVIVPADGLVKLYSLNLPIACGWYGSKQGNPGVWIEAAKSGDARYVPVSGDILRQGGLFGHPGIVVGMGCALIRMDVFKAIGEPWFHWSQGREPGGVSEDFFFCEKVRSVVPIHVVNGVQCLHIDWTALNPDGQMGRLTI